MLLLEGNSKESLELGLDIGSVELVIHYGSPRQVSKFMQRIGRSKHDRGDSARGLIITENADDEFEIQAIIERIKEGSIEEQKIHHGSLDVLAHHLVGLSMQVGNVPIEAALKLTKLAYPFRDISLEEFFDVLEILALRELIIFNDDKTEYKKNTAFFATKYHFQNLSTIPDILKFKVKELSMEESMPKVFKELQKILKNLEKHYKDMQDVEFTVENNKLWMLQNHQDQQKNLIAHHYPYTIYSV